MSILKTSSRWPLYLAVAGLIIVSASVWYTNRLASQLAEIERKNVSLYMLSLQRLNNFNPEQETQGVGDDASMELNILAGMKTTPRLLVSLRGEIDDAQGFGEKGQDTVYLKRTLKSWIAQGIVPVQIDAQKLYVGESWLLQQLRYFPYIQLVLIT
ncbi:MAG: two-component sensor histidine kinase, partial [Bacteroidota bacterium]